MSRNEDNEIALELSYENVEALQHFSQLLKKDINTILNKALEQYFVNEQRRLQEEEQLMTNLDFDEFWDGVDV